MTTSLRLVSNPKPQSAGQLELPIIPRLSLAMRVVVNRWITRDWHDRAACKTTEDPAFYSDKPAEQKKATQRVCGSCPVRRACLASALLNDEQGVWGGTTESEREAITTRLADLSPYWVERTRTARPAACCTEWTPGPKELDPVKLFPARRDQRTAA
ncbi:WhiB family transcriptional regulator [Kribbella sp. NBC_01505]|uniref:WhiB family transcriptional regulator n=1 Tax=Kribbella sp. NBC_01505 TaxID=2903580 RepID=UPI003867F518